MSERIVLLVEDNQDDIDLTLLAFQRHRFPHRIVVVHDGVEALDYLFATGAFAGRPAREMPAVVLLDLKLPRLDGLQVLQRIRNDERTRHLPVVVLTSSNEERDLVRSYDLGANSYVRTPVDFDRFLDAARHLGLYWLVMNEPPPMRA